MTRILATLLSLALVPQFGGMAGIGGKAGTGGGACVLPAYTYIWRVGNPLTLCSGSVACTNGASIQSIPSLTTANTATTSGTPPVYNTGAVNGQDVAAFTQFSTTATTLATAIPASGTVTEYVVWKSASGRAIFSGNSTAGNAFEYREATQNQQVCNQGSGCAGGSHSFSASSYVAALATLTPSSGAFSMSYISGGTATVDASGSSLTGITQPINALGYSLSDGSFTGTIAEWGINLGAATGTEAGYIKCQYGI